MTTKNSHLPGKNGIGIHYEVLIFQTTIVVNLSVLFSTCNGLKGYWDIK
jgi:hypothetical protein